MLLLKGQISWNFDWISNFQPEWLNVTAPQVKSFQETEIYVSI